MRRAVLTVSAATAALLALAGCSGGGDGEPGRAGTTGSTSATSAPGDPTGSTPTPPTFTAPVDCAAFVAAVNADVVPLLATGGATVADLTFVAEEGGESLCAARNEAGDDIASLLVDDEGCVGRVQQIPAAGAGSYACVATKGGNQFLQGTVLPAGGGRSVNALVTLVPGADGPRYRLPDLAPIAATLTRSLFRVIG